MEYLFSFNYDWSPANNELLEDIIIAIEEVKLIKAGKKKGRPVEDLLNGL